MKSPIRKAILLFGLPMVAFVSCRKSDSSSPATAAPVDAIIGTYNGYMHIHTWSMYYSDTSTISTTDTTYPLSMTIHKIAADTFMVGDSLFLNWSSIVGTIVSTAHIRYDSSGNYKAYQPWGEWDSLHFVPSADSMYFYTSYDHPGGATTEFKTQTFTGKK